MPNIFMENPPSFLFVFNLIASICQAIQVEHDATDLFSAAVSFSYHISLLLQLIPISKAKNRKAFFYAIFPAVVASKDVWNVSV